MKPEQAVAFLCHRPDTASIRFYESFAEAGYQVFVVIDDHSWPTAVTARKDDASAAGQAAMANLAVSMSMSGRGGLIQTSSGCRQQRVDRLQRCGCS